MNDNIELSQEVYSYIESQLDAEHKTPENVLALFMKMKEYYMAELEKAISINAGIKIEDANEHITGI